MTYNNPMLWNALVCRLSNTPHLPLSALCAAFGVSRQYIERLVITNTGVSFRILKKRKLMEKALFLLSNLSADGHAPSYKQVAFALGFACPASFSRFVKRETGMKPSTLIASLYAREDAT